MAERSRGPDALLDLLVFAPLGLAVRVADELPELARLGRSTAERQVTTARAVGELAVAYARQRLRSRVGTSEGRAGAAVGDPPQAPPARGTAAAESPATGADASAAPVVEAGAGSPSPETGSDRAAASRPVADRLAIPGYDALAASQVVARLASLEPAELDAVEAYERATRGRRTVLHRIAQLRAEHEPVR